MVLIFAAVAPLDGEPGLSVKDIEFKYYGNRSGTRLEAAMKGPMKVYHSLPPGMKRSCNGYTLALPGDSTQRR